MRKYLIVGTGGTGGAIGAYLARAGMDVTFIARGEHLKAIKEKIGIDTKAFSKPALNNARQLGLLSKAKESLITARNDAENDLTVDLISVSLLDAYASILEILGEANQLDLSKEIFSRFCVGK